MNSDKLIDEAIGVQSGGEASAGTKRPRDVVDGVTETQQQESEEKRNRTDNDALSRLETKDDISTGRVADKESTGAMSATDTSTVALIQEDCTAPRWRAHQLVDDYVAFSSNMLLIPQSQLGTYGYNPSHNQYPLSTISVLGYLKSPLRRPIVVEKWSPLEVATFEAAICEHGKQFHKIQHEISSTSVAAGGNSNTKSTREVIEFYYMWKKTAHYQEWKRIYVSPTDATTDHDSDAGKNIESG